MNKAELLQGGGIGMILGKYVSIQRKHLHIGRKFTDNYLLTDLKTEMSSS